MSKSRKLFNDSKKVIPSGVNSPVRYFDPYPFFTKKANGPIFGMKITIVTSIFVMHTVRCY